MRLEILSAATRAGIGAKMSSARRALWHFRSSGLTGLREHRRREQGLPPDRGVRAQLTGRGELSFEPWDYARAPRRRQGLTVAVILDDFSRLAFSFEWDQVHVTPQSWREHIGRIQLLFVESAWNGNDGAWQYRLTGGKGPSQELKDLVAECKSRGIPTVFWNKEDPSHTEDFLECARLFDQVFTTDADLLDFYRAELDHDRVGVLAFAAQPAIHNPIRPAAGYQERDIAFAGMYFAHRHSERREQMDLLLGAAMDVTPRLENGLEIFSRQLGGDDRYQFPSPLAERVVGSLNYQQMLSAYRAYKVFLNVNTVVGSPTMCARRVFEISACGTPVVSTPNPAISATFPADEVVQVGERDEAGFALRALVNSPEIRDRMVHRAQRRIWAEHTYAHRVDAVLDAVGLDGHLVRSRPQTVTALVSSNRPQQLEHVLRSVGSQRGVETQLAYLAHGWDVDERRLRDLAAEAGLSDVVVLSADANVPLGDCLNRLVDAADGELVAKMDDDDYYGPHYLQDSLAALDLSGAQLVGKQAHYVALTGQGLLALRFPTREHQFVRHVMGPTMTMARSTARSTRFEPLAVGEDTAFLRALTTAGGRVYAGSRFEFAQLRGGTEHTWTASDFEILASATVQVVGSYEAHVTV